MAGGGNHDTPSSASPQPARRVYLRSEEIALEPPWARMDQVLDFLAKGRVTWRLDPIFRCITVDDPSVAAKLKSTFGCKDVSKQLRRFLAQAHGVRVVGCERFAGMLVYDLSDDLLYHVDASSFKVHPFPDALMAPHFRGLGRAATHGVRYEFDSLADAVEAYKEHATKEQTEWIARHALSSKPQNQHGDNQ